MSTMLRAADAPARRRADHWRQVLDQTLGPLEVRPGGVDRRDQLLVGDAGAVRVAELTAAVASGADRTRGHIRRSDLDVCKIDVLAQGRGVIAQDGREASLGRATSPSSTCRARRTGPCRRCGWSRWCSRGRCCRCVPARSRG